MSVLLSFVSLAAAVLAIALLREHRLRRSLLKLLKAVFSRSSGGCDQ